VIVTCGQCDTQFRLDEAKVGPKGLRVRCSLCKHSFFVAPPPASRAERVEQLAREALESGPRSPEPTADLGADAADPDEETAPDLGRAARAPAPPGGALDDDGDWKFNEEAAAEDATQPIGLAPEEGPDLELDSRTPAAACEPGAPEGREELGSPESWDLLGPGGEDSLAARAPLALRGPSASAPSAAAARFAASDLGASLREAAEALAEAEGSAAWPRLARGAAALGWLVATALFGAGLAAGLGRGAPPAARTGMQQVAGLEAQVARARYVENAVAGPLYVISGELRNPGTGTAQPGERMGVRLVDARGRDLVGAPAPLGPPLTERELREWPPDRLAREQEEGALRLAQVPLRPGQRWLFDAVLAGIPAAAAGFRFELAPAPPDAPPPPGPPSPSVSEAGTEAAPTPPATATAPESSLP
jgi:predicted Zn finger-like uncharacterized protein